MFTAGVLALLLAGGAAVSLLPRDTAGERGAMVGDHWHAAYRVELCGKRLQPFPHVEGEIHTHGDGQIHMHPTTQALADQNANLGAFFRSVETLIGVTSGGDRFIVLPDGSRYQGGDTCPGSSFRHELQVLVGDSPGEESAIEDDPSLYAPQEGESVIVRFGPEATEETANPLSAR